MWSVSQSRYISTSRKLLLFAEFTINLRPASLSPEETTQQIYFTSKFRAQKIRQRTFSLAWISLSFLLASTCICDETCFRVLVFPVRNLMYRAINSFRPRRKEKGKIFREFLFFVSASSCTVKNAQFCVAKKDKSVHTDWDIQRGLLLQLETRWFMEQVSCQFQMILCFHHGSQVLFFFSSTNKQTLFTSETDSSPRSVSMKVDHLRKKS